MISTVVFSALLRGEFRHRYNNAPSHTGDNCGDQGSNREIWNPRPKPALHFSDPGRKCPVWRCPLNGNETLSLGLNLNPEHSGTPGSLSDSGEWQHWFLPLPFPSALPPTLSAFLSCLPFCFFSFYFCPLSCLYYEALPEAICVNSPYNSKRLGQCTWFSKSYFLFCFISVITNSNEIMERGHLS